MFMEGLHELTVLGSGMNAMEQHWPACYSQEIPSSTQEAVNG